MRERLSFSHLTALFKILADLVNLHPRGAKQWKLLQFLLQIERDESEHMARDQEGCNGGIPTFEFSQFPNIYIRLIEDHCCEAIWYTCTGSRHEVVNFLNSPIFPHQVNSCGVHTREINCTSMADGDLA